jgi:DNA helicase IV
MISMSEMNEMITELERLDVLNDAKAQEKKATQEAVDRQRSKILAELEAQKIDSFKGSIGTVTVTNRWNVKAPKESETREALRKFMESKNQFESLWTINHATLNAWYKEEVENAKERGEMLDIVGLTPVLDKTLSFRRSAK